MSFGFFEKSYFSSRDSKILVERVHCFARVQNFVHDNLSMEVRAHSYGWEHTSFCMPSSSMKGGVPRKSNLKGAVAQRKVGLKASQLIVQTSVMTAWAS